MMIDRLLLAHRLGEYLPEDLDFVKEAHAEAINYSN